MEALIQRRAERLRREAVKLVQPQVPVIIVGNITVGGTGKTPCLITLTSALQKQFTVAVICRGHGGSEHEPRRVNGDDSAQDCGDEALLLAQSLDCPVYAGRDRRRTALLAEQEGAAVIVSDDGLQHYRLKRDVELALVSAQRGLGNGRCLPFGPLREPRERLQCVDAILLNGTASEADQWPDAVSLSIEPQPLEALVPNRTADTPQRGDRVNAVTGIGEPERFVATLKDLGFEVSLHAWPDHHRFDGSELEFDDGRVVLVTAKDAVKLRQLHLPERTAPTFVVPIQAKLPDAWLAQLIERIRNLGA